MEATISSGQRHLIPSFLRAKEWAPAALWRDSWRALELLSFPLVSQTPFYDIDVVDDLTRLAEELRLAPARAPRTAEWLKEWEPAEPQSRAGLRTGTGEL